MVIASDAAVTWVWPAVQLAEGAYQGGVGLQVTCLVDLGNQEAGCADPRFLRPILLILSRERRMLGTIFGVWEPERSEEVRNRGVW